VARPGEAAATPDAHDVLARGRAATVVLDLKTRSGTATALQLIEHADALIEGFRPGVMERLGLSPEACHARNPRLVFGRVTGWGQDGPLAARAGHDINYIALSGVLAAIGPRQGGPVPPLNLVGDYGGGGMLLAFGVLCALLEARNSGRGQVVDAAMLDGAALLMAQVCGLRAAGQWNATRGDNALDGGAHFYRCYRCLDDRWLAVGAIEPQFQAQLFRTLGITEAAPVDPGDRSRWAELSATLKAAFSKRSRDDWCRLFEGQDACVSPVLDLDEVAAHPHNVARASFVEIAGVLQPAAAPRFSRSKTSEMQGCPMSASTTLNQRG
jgi:alpha-methylacyl-CoA racemase